MSRITTPASITAAPEASHALLDAVSCWAVFQTFSVS